MKLYHGTNEDFDKINLLKSRPIKILGVAFICRLTLNRL